MFSFNSPYGACPDCDGLGVRKTMDKDRILVDETKSLREGALGWGDANWYQVLEWSIFRAYGVNPQTPYKHLPAAFKQILWDGAGERIFDFRWKGKRSTYKWQRTWEGILPSLERKHRESQSESRREELERFMSVHPCAACGGARLKPETLAVRVDGRNILEHVAQEKLGRHDEARVEFERAASLTRNRREREVLLERRGKAGAGPRRDQ